MRKQTQTQAKGEKPDAAAERRVLASAVVDEFETRFGIDQRTVSGMKDLFAGAAIWLCVSAITAFAVGYLVGAHWQPVQG